MKQVVVRCQGLCRTYQQGSVPVHALQSVDLEIAEGEFTSLSGPSGSGKSTLLNIIGGLDKFDQGRVSVGGVELGGLRESQLSALRLAKIGFVFQAYNLIPVLSALENVAFILQLQGVGKREQRVRAEQMLADLGLADMLHRRPGELSGGQQQRVAIARAMVTNPVLLLADEPTANLDSQTTAELLSLMRDLNESKGMTIVTATHDPLVIAYTSRQVGLIDGRISSDD
ncbi:MAG TPA: macrolide ABC transporter ATP-binding protein [Gammaproteobacteria bacterium]|nr:macrolide ABC transporter ATP-binding protein [Gammaproteobacteria bacterium]HBK18535.1 macrolide ABC transporter ATP-binding protein [Gammaproteobacteria bacterium]